MSLLIDGYNLLHATDIFGRGDGPGGFQRSREALLRFLASSLGDDERRRTTIVFDAADAPPGLPKTVTEAEMLVRYAADYPDADTLIEELIASHDAPRSLLVVSSDHRIQRAARRRRAKSIDSEQWYSQLWQQRINLRQARQRPIPEKPMGQLSAAEIDYWVEEFADAPSDDAPSDVAPSGNDEPDSTTHRDDSPAGRNDDLSNPFPPGYADDLLADDDN